MEALEAMGAKDRELVMRGEEEEELVEVVVVEWGKMPIRGTGESEELEFIVIFQELMSVMLVEGEEE